MGRHPGEIDAACSLKAFRRRAAAAEYGGAQFEVNLGHLDDPVSPATTP